MTLSLLKQELRNGKHPAKDLGGTTLGSGMFRTAYAVGAFVVKQNGDTTNASFQYKQTYTKEYRDSLRLANTRFAPTLVLGQWRIQLRYEPMTEKQWAEVRDILNNIGDLYYPNIGVDKRGRYVAFDW